jgi:hypothetical protein
LTSSVQVCPAGQQALHPHAVSLPLQLSRHTPPLQNSPQVQAGVQVLGVHTPATQVSPVTQVCSVQVPPQPSESPQFLPAQSGVQQSSALQTSPAEQAAVQVPSQPSLAPPHFAAPAAPVQLAVQHMPVTLSQRAGLVQPQVPPQPSEPPQDIWLQVGVQQASS